MKSATRVPVSVKLSPNAWNIAGLAAAAEAAGADAITAVNTVSGMAINVRARSPVLHNKQGGVSGPALFPLALKCVYDIYERVRIPIIGTGGVTTGEDALAMIMAGATLVGIGSAVYYRGAEVFKKISETDKDLDGLTDAEEKKYGTDPAKADTDGDGILDKDEIAIYRSNPLKADTDGDGVKDGAEVRRGLNPNGAGKLSL